MQPYPERTNPITAYRKSALRRQFITMVTAGVATITAAVLLALFG